MSQLSNDFLIELAKSCLVSKDILEVVKPHLSYTFISEETYKHIFKYIFDYYGANNKPPTVGLVSQNVHAREALDVIAKIREVNVYDNKEQIIKTFEGFVKKSRFVGLHKKTEELYNTGKQDQAIALLAEESKAINEFSLGTKMLSRVFADFDVRQNERQSRDLSVHRIPTGIPALDHHTRGGIDRGTGLLAVGRSGSGKTTFLRSLGFHAAFRGFNVVHFASGDSTKEEIEDGYDAAWTGVEVFEIRKGEITGVDAKKIEQARKQFLAQSGEIFIHVFNQFNTASIADCRTILIELMKEIQIDEVVFDYLEKFDPGDGKKYSTNAEGERARKMAVGEKIINIATEFNIAVATVTQASDIKREQWNNPNWFITRNDISNLKATIDPFAYCITLNQTDDENDKDEMRIHEEKLRHSKTQTWSSTYKIVQEREKGRFINVAETKKKFWDDEKKQIIRNTPKA